MLYILNRNYKESQIVKDETGILTNDSITKLQLISAQIEGGFLPQECFEIRDNMMCIDVSKSFIIPDLFIRTGSQIIAFSENIFQKIIDTFPETENLRNLEIFNSKNRSLEYMMIGKIPKFFVEGMSGRFISKQDVNSKGLMKLSENDLSDFLENQPFAFIQQYKELPFVGRKLFNALGGENSIIMEEDDKDSSLQLNELIQSNPNDEKLFQNISSFLKS